MAKGKMRGVVALLVFVTLGFSLGCVERKMVITTDPPGATVVVNQTWSGTTPYTLKFKHYGTYSIRIEKPGYYPLDLKEPLAAPFYEQPGVDLVSEAMIPKKVYDVRELHYVLQKIEDTDEVKDIVARSEAFAAGSEKIATERQEKERTRESIRLPLSRTPAGEARAKRREAERKSPPTVETKEEVPPPASERRPLPPEIQGIDTGSGFPEEGLRPQPIPLE